MTKSRFYLFDKGHNILESLAIVAKNLTVPGFTMGLVGAIFSASIGVALIMLVAKQGKLSDAVAVSWLLAAFVFAGLATMIVALYTREPVVIAWSIPGALIVGKYLQMGGNIYDAAGAYIMIAVLVLILTYSGLIKTLIEYIPVPIMLGMVGGVFLSYGLNAFTYALQNVSVCAYMVGAFFVWYAIKPLARKVPPVFIAGVAGGIALKFLGGGAKAPIEWSVATPVFITPHFSFYSIFTLVIPLFLMVIGVQNIQAVGVLLARDYIPPINTIYTTPSIVTFFNAFMGAHTAVTAGPSTAIVSSEAAGKKEYRFIAAFFEGCWWVLIGLLGKVGVGLSKQVPAEFIWTLAGLALFDVFIDTIHAAFSDKLKKGAMVAFLIAASNVSLFKIGAAFWAIVAGVIVSLALEWQDFGNTTIKNEQEPQTQHAK